jgi:hypothetical protein
VDYTVTEYQAVLDMLQQVVVVQAGVVMVILM